MKTDLIILSLKSIQDENNNRIINNKNEIKKLEECLKKLESDILALNTIENRCNIIKGIKKSIIKLTKAILIPLQIPAIVFLIIAIICLAENLSICFILALLCSGLALDVIYTFLADILPFSSDDNGIIRSYISFFKELFTNKKMIEKKLEETRNKKEDYAKEIEEIERRKNALLSECSQINDENDYISGNEIGLNILAKKYQLEDINDNLEIVNFVNKRLERKVR